MVKKRTHKIWKMEQLLGVKEELDNAYLLKQFPVPAPTRSHAQRRPAPSRPRREGAHGAEAIRELLTKAYRIANPLPGNWVGTPHGAVRMGLER